MTDYSNYYLDWSRVGELLQSGRHRYTREQLITRAAIMLPTIAASYYGWTTGDSPMTSGLYSMAWGFSSFVITHTIAIAPLIYKRWQMSEECHKQQEVILDLLPQILDLLQEPVAGELCEKIADKINQVMTSSKSTDKHSKASQTWGSRKRQMIMLANNLSNAVEHLKDGTANIQDFRDFLAEDEVLSQALKTELESPNDVIPSEGIVASL